MRLMQLLMETLEHAARFFARNIVVEPNLYILGEAKTLNDYFKRQSEADNQMNVMINFLKNNSGQF